mmetsp:Transcript_31545/g.76979  ORF Transcript_31545/g.76979 Transcript_31545/m.76979 type:complete len:1145 (-) Transcript_31545:146-3580(-)
MDKAAQQFEQVALAAMSPNNAVRSKAEGMYRSMRTQPAVYVEALFQTLSHTNHGNVRVFCCVMLRQDVNPESKVWQSAPPQTRQLIKKQLMSLLSKPMDRKLRRLLTDATGLLSSHTFSEGKWDDLLPFVLQQAKSRDAGMVCTGLGLVATLVEFANETLQKARAYPPIHKVVGSALNSKPKDNNDSSTFAVMQAAAKALVELLISITPEDQSLRVFAELIPSLFQVMSSLARAHQDEELTACVDEATKLVSHRWFLVEPLAEKVLELLSQIATEQHIEDGVKRQAMAMISEMLGRGRSKIRKMGIVRTRLVPLAFAYLRKLELSVEEWAAKGSFDFEEEDFRVGMETMDYLSCHLGEEVFFPVLWDIVRPALSSSNWVDRHSSMMAICAALEGSAKAMCSKLEMLVKAVVPLIRSDPHPRVRWAAINIVAHLCNEFAPAIQEAFGQILLEAVTSAMTEPKQIARVAAHAALCIVDFCKSDTSRQIIKYRNQVLKSLFYLISQGSNKSDARVLSAAMAAIPAVIEVEFGPENYDDDDEEYEADAKQSRKSLEPEIYRRSLQGAVDILKYGLNKGQQLKQAGKEGKEESLWLMEMRSNAIRCVGILAECVRSEDFAKDAKQVMSFVSQAQRDLDQNDTAQEKILEVYTKISSVLKEAFSPYLKHVVPPLLANATRKGEAWKNLPDEGGPSNEQIAEQNGLEVYEVNVHGVGTKRVVINTALIDSKAGACLRLGEYAQNLPEAFFQYLKQTVDAIIPLIAFEGSPRIRIPAMRAVPHLVRCASRKNPELGMKLWIQTLKGYERACAMEDEPQHLGAVLLSLSDAIDEVKPPIGPQFWEGLDKLMLRIIHGTLGRRAEYDARLKMVGVDDQEIEEIEESLDGEDHMIGFLSEVVKSLVKNTKGGYLKSFHKNLLGQFSRFMGDDSSPALQCVGICCICEVLGVAGPQNPLSKEYARKFLPQSIKRSEHPSVDVRQSAVFAVGLCAEILGPKEFSPHGREAMNILTRNITGPKSREGENGPCADNAISSVAKICKIMGPDVRKSVLPTWTTWLPCKSDPSEAMVVHEHLVKFLMGGDEKYILGENKRNLPKLFKIFSTVLGSEDLANAKTKKEMRAIASKLLQNMNGAARSRLMELLSTEERNILLKV